MAQRREEGQSPPVAIRRSPRLARASVRVMLVFGASLADEDQERNRAALYFFPCTRRCATSGRSCSPVCRLLF